MQCPETHSLVGVASVFLLDTIILKSLVMLKWTYHHIYIYVCNVHIFPHVCINVFLYTVYVLSICFLKLKKVFHSELTARLALKVMCALGAEKRQGELAQN